MKQALIIIDLINDITGKHGLSNACHDQTAARNLIAATRKPPVRRGSGIFPWYGCGSGLRMTGMISPPDHRCFSGQKRLVP